jgi:molecular chaperone GrpE
MKNDNDAPNKQDIAGKSQKAHAECNCTLLKAERDGLEKELQSERAKVLQYQDMLKRHQADFENHLKRESASRRESTNNAVYDLALKILSALDSMDLALTACPKDDDGRKMLDGFKRVNEQLKSILASEGVNEIGTDGIFSPDVHEAVDVVADEDRQEGTIVDVIQKGYTLNGRVIRTAKVTVVKNKR